MKNFVFLLGAIFAFFFIFSGNAYARCEPRTSRDCPPGTYFCWGPGYVDSFCCTESVTECLEPTPTPISSSLSGSGECIIPTNLRCGACGISTPLGCIETSPANFVAWLLRFAIGIGGGIAFLLMLWGGLQIIVSTGNPEKIKAGREIMTSALAGLLLIIFSVFLLRLIGYDILRLPGFRP